MGIFYSQEEKTPLDVTDIDDPQDKNFGNYDFPFENLVIEGGGARGVAYVGALRVLESAGILQNIKRVAGVSAGAITATFVAMGLSCADVAEQADVDLGKILISGGYLQTLVKPVNLYWRYGWETGDGFYAFFGGILEKFTRKDGRPGNPDITFKQLYKMSGIELCIVVTNLDQMTEEYCHVKTTPELPIRKAVRMSMSIPGLFQPVLTDYHGHKEFYVDGGVVCNYPLHSFDGWWLSMEEGDSFFSRLDDLAHLSRSMHRSNRFEPVSPKTIGLMLYSDDDIEQYQQVLCDRLTQEERLYEKKRPDTEAARVYEDKRAVETVEAMENRKKIRGLIDKFLTSLKGQNKDHTATVSRQELHGAFTEAGNNYLTDSEKKKLFGDAYSVDQLFDQMDADKDGKLTFQEVHEFFTNRGFSWLTRSMEEKRKHVSSLTDYTLKYMDLLGVLGKKVYRKVDDIERSIGVDSDYVKTTDFQLEDEDKMFLFKRGATGARAFLRTFIAKNNLKPTKSAGKRRWKNLQRCVLFTPRQKKSRQDGGPVY
ncbi:Hypp7665 [Branchiostoma lanceolatum]|uniref:Hypp7665 protein n=1 Tax=Branchiostoma lanceolatum TaxID=7740 RepID=A0A8J9Z200_BRALA|nr:Hypp7665 [Branchiostoma lanceolatum]